MLTSIVFFINIKLETQSWEESVGNNFLLNKFKEKKMLKDKNK